MTADTFPGNVVDDGSRIDLDSPAAMRQHVKALAGERVEVIVRKRKSQRSNKQNAWLHGVALPALVEALGNKLGYEKSEMKLVLLGEKFGYHWNEIAQRDIPVKSHTSELNTKEFSEFMEWLVDWAGSQHGVYVALPDEVRP